MKIAVIIFLSCLFATSLFGAGQDIALPKMEAKIGMDVLQAMESRAASRSFSGKEVPLKAISTILWAGYGIILENGDKTVHGHDALSGATSQRDVRTGRHAHGKSGQLVSGSGTRRYWSDYFGLYVCSAGRQAVILIMSMNEISHYCKHF